MNHSESLKELAAALAKAQGEIENAAKNANNPHFGKKYADLAEVLNTARPVLAKFGLAVIQIPGWNDGRVTVETMLTHSSGEWVSGVAESPIPRADPQGVGAATTYLRRYSLAAVVGIAQEDDDAESVVRPPARQAARSAKVETPPNAAAALRKIAIHTDPETAADIERQIAAGLTVVQARELLEKVKATMAVTGNGAST